MNRDAYVSFRHEKQSVSIAFTPAEREALQRYAFGARESISNLVRLWLRTAAGAEDFDTAARKAGVPVSGWYRLVVLHAIGESDLGAQLARLD